MVVLLNNDLANTIRSKVDIVGDNIEYNIEKELGIEIVGDTKVRIETSDDEDEWDEEDDWELLM